VAASVCEYAVPTVPLGSGELVVIDSGGGVPVVVFRAKLVTESLT
jgi:hypothetical protein